MESIKKVFILTSNVSVEEFQIILKNFDWSYGYSDNHNVYHRGNEDEQMIDGLLKSQPELQKVYDEYKQKRDDANATHQAEQLSARMKIQQQRNDFCLMPLLQNWYLVDLENGKEDMETPIGLIVVYGPQGEFNTTRIISVEGTLRDTFVITKSGSKYRLGNPHSDLNKHIFKSKVYDFIAPLMRPRLGFDTRVFVK